MTQIITVTPDELQRMVQAAVRAELSPIASAIAPLLDEAGWLTIAGAAEKFNVDRSTINRWVQNGRMEAKGAGQSRRVRMR